MERYNGREWYTAKEYGEKIGKSRQTVTNWINSGKFGEYLLAFKGVNHISEDALKDPVVGDGSVSVPDPADPPVNPREDESSEETIPANSDFTAYLLTEVDRLRAELKDKEAEIADLRRQLDAHTERLTSITEESQRIAKQALDTAGNAQRLQAVTMLPAPETAPEEPEKRKGLLSRFRK